MAQEQDILDIGSLEVSNEPSSEFVESLQGLLSNINYFAIIKICIELAIMIAICTGLFILIDKLSKKFTKVMQRRHYDLLLIRFMPLITKFLKSLVGLFFIFVFAGSHGLNLTSVMAGIGIGGLAVGFAAKETISDVFGTVVLIFDKSAKVGDIVQVDKSIDGKDILGIVEDINFRSTKIRTFDGSLNTIPNHILASSVIRNLTTVTRRRFTEYIDIIYETPIEKVQEALDICKRIIKEHDRISDNSLVELNTLGASSLKIMLRIDTFAIENIDEPQAIKTQVLMRILEEFRKANIEFAYNTQTLYLKNS